jgi:hypothetical protein
VIGHGSNLSITDSDVSDPTDVVLRVDDVSALQQQIVAGLCAEYACQSDQDKYILHGTYQTSLAPGQS